MAVPVKRVAHIGIAVRDTERAMRFFCGELALEARHVEILEAAGLKITFVPVGDTLIEFLEPISDRDHDVTAFLAAHGEGINHICFDVPDIATAVQHLKERGVAMVDQEPRRGGLGARIAFIDKSASSGIVVELSEGQQDSSMTSTT